MADTEIRGVAPEANAASDNPPDTAAAEVAPMPIVRLSINLAKDSADSLRGSARKRGITITDATRRAIAITELLDEELESGHTIQSVGPGGTVTRLVFI